MVLSGSLVGPLILTIFIRALKELTVLLNILIVRLMILIWYFTRVCGCTENNPFNVNNYMCYLPNKGNLHSWLLLYKYFTFKHAILKKKVRFCLLLLGLGSSEGLPSGSVLSMFCRLALRHNSSWENISQYSPQKRLISCPNNQQPKGIISKVINKATPKFNILQNKDPYQTPQTNQPLLFQSLTYTRPLTENIASIPRYRLWI